MADEDRLGYTEGNSNLAGALRYYLLVNKWAELCFELEQVY